MLENFSSRWRAISAIVIALHSLPAAAWAQLRSEPFLNGLSSPIAFVQDPSNAAVQYIVEQGGQIRVVANGALQAADFLDLSSQTNGDGERGLLGLAFPANYGATGRFFVYFTNLDGDIVIARFNRSGVNPLVANPATRYDFLWPGGTRFISHSEFGNHNGGTLAFGPDGYLYAGIGDGGSSNDPHHNAQDPTTLLGKMLRLNVNVLDNDVEGYDIPSDNPFLDGIPVAALPQIWAFGLRNPWKYSFDNAALGGTGALVIADVGQGRWEEVDYQPSGQGGRNFGWRNREGAHTNDDVEDDPPAYLPLTDPIHEYSHPTGIAITGGYVYRGGALGIGNRGRYFFGDLNGRVWSIALTVNSGTGEATASNLVEHTTQLGGGATLGSITSFGEDANGELYIVNYGAGTVVRIAPTCPFTLNPTMASYDAAAGGGTVAVTAPAGCGWDAVSNNAFITVTGGASGTGNGIVTYTVAANGPPNVATPARSGTITIGGQTFTVNQTGCTFGLAPTSTTFGSSAGAGEVSVTTPGGCSWTVTGVPVWAMTSMAGGTGSATWQYVVAANATGTTRTQSIVIGGQNFQLTQRDTLLTSLVPGTRTAFPLANSADERWSAIEAVGGRSYCAQVMPDATAVDRATPTVIAFRADGATPLGSGSGVNTRTCFVAPASETELLRVTQSDTSPRPHRLAVVETTLWANWFFIGGDYSSFTILRNTTTGSGPITATITWRSGTGVVVGGETVSIAAGGTIYRDARITTSGATAGSVEVAHDGEPQALVGSQTTLSATTGLSFDTVLAQRLPQ